MGQIIHPLTLLVHLVVFLAFMIHPFNWNWCISNAVLGCIWAASPAAAIAAAAVVAKAVWCTWTDSANIGFSHWNQGRVRERDRYLSQLGKWHPDWGRVCTHQYRRYHLRKYHRPLSSSLLHPLLCSWSLRSSPLVGLSCSLTLSMPNWMPNLFHYTMNRRIPSHSSHSRHSQWVLGWPVVVLSQFLKLIRIDDE